DAGIESDQDARKPAADILDRVTIALRDVADVTLLQSLDPLAAGRAEKGDPPLPFDDVLPLVGVRMPVQCPQCAGIEIEHDAGDRLRNREASGIDAPLAGAPIGS